MNKLGNILSNEKIRYIVAGIWNTIFGYTVTIIIYFLAKDQINTFFIGIIANVFSISQSFVVHKLFVFKTEGDWLKELIRSYMVYGVAALLSSGLLWILVDLYKINIFTAQTIVILTIILVSYIGHREYTFKK